jgi:diguanylate cyclase (GGDEF)-like protein
VLWLVVVVAGTLAVATVRLTVPTLGPIPSESMMAALALLAAVPAVLGAVRHRDVVRAWIAAGIVLWAAGSVTIVAILAGAEVPPLFPTPAEGLWLLSYACLLGAVLASISRHARTRDPGRWLDALVVLVATAGLAVVVVRPWIGGPAFTTLGEVTVTAFFGVDVLMLGAVLAGLLVTGARPRPVWLALGGGVALVAVTDLLYALRLVDPTSVVASELDVGWPLALLVLGAFAYRAPFPAPERAPIAQHMPVLPLIGSAGAIAVLVYDHYEQISDAGLWLTVATLVLGLVRTVLVMRANVALGESERQALTDDLTGLGNRRRLYRDLDATLAGRSAGATLALFDLDGFKAYNDGYGHVAGDALLAELSHRLTVAVGGDGVAYRLGGDEFCVITTADGVIDRALGALRADGITASGGSVSVPSEATDIADALRIADMRMYADKAARRTAA